MAMLAKLERPDARLLARRWASLNGSTRVALPDGEVHYLTTMALAADDDLVAHLLLAKLRLAARVGNDGAPEVARTGSLVEFDDGSGAPRLARLMHPGAPDAPHGIGVTTLLGAGLVGLGEGQATLWPDEWGDFHPLTILRIASPAAGAANPTQEKDRT